MQVAILGRQPKLSVAELERIYGAEAISEISDEAALVEVDEPLDQNRLGGTIKSAKLLTRLESTDLEGAFAYLQKTVPDHLEYLPDGKLQLGVSVYGFKAQKNWLLKRTLTLKKVIKNTGRSVRIIENKSEALDAAQVLYNKLTGPLGWELLIIKDGKDVLLAQTTGVQNIDDYSRRDFDRPKRDAYVGMLPPKLAQIMINLAVGSWNTEDSHPPILLDAFCGTGVIPQEALLMGLHVIATDIEQKMIDFTQANIEWLHEQVQYDGFLRYAQAADAITEHWFEAENIDAVVSETYLGKPLTTLPSESKLKEIMDESNTIAEGFLKNVASQLKKGTRLCIALPAWHISEGRFKHLKVLDRITDMGYNRVDLKHATHDDLIYHRPDQVVARQLIILEKN